MLKEIRLIKLSEAQIKSGIANYLETLQAMGKLWYTRLNSGTFVMGEGKSKRVIRGTKAGTADFLVIRRCYPLGAPNKDEVFVTFLEVKTEKGRQNQAQIDFQKLVESQGHLYKIVKSVDEVISLLGG